MNFITGISDGLVLPFVAGFLSVLYFAGTPLAVVGISLLVAILGAIAYGAARYFGEKEEIRHNHPQLALHEAQKESELMDAIGIDANLSRDMQAKMEQERELWLSEVEENNMGWESYDGRRALKSGLQTALGFFAGGFMVSLPFCLQYSSLEYLALPCIYYLLLLFIFGWIKGKLLGTKPAQKAFYLASRGFVLIVLAVTVLAFIEMTREGGRDSETMTEITP